MNFALKLKKSPLATHAFCGIARLTVGRIIILAMASLDGGSATHGSHRATFSAWSWGDHD